MNLPNSFKVMWWLLLCGATGSYLLARRSALLAGNAVPADIVAFIVWTALMLSPVFTEIEFFGFRFKRELEKAKEELRTELASVRADLRNAVDVRTSFSPQISFPAPPPDYQLPGLESRVKAAVSEALTSHGLQQPLATASDLAVSDDATFLFKTRYSIERELKRLHQERLGDLHVTRSGGYQLSRQLAQYGVIERSLDNAIREVYSVASNGIHGGDVTQAQVDFVRDVGPQLVGTLRALRGEAG